MPNDAKLGLLVGVAGVFAAAVLFFQDRPAPTAPVSAVVAAPEAPATPKPPAIFGKKPSPKDAANPDRRREKPEPEAQPVSRAAE
jgi:hypothetical protein